MICKIVNTIKATLKAFNVKALTILLTITILITYLINPYRVDADSTSVLTSDPHEISSNLPLCATIEGEKIVGQTCRLPDCASEELINKDAKPGFNCLFSKNGKVKKLCSNIHHSGYGVLPGAIIPTFSIKKPRENCLNLSDLPKCSHLDQNQAKSTKNCFRECKNIYNADTTASDGKKRGIDYAIHDLECVNLGSDGQSELGIPQIPIKCHQLDSGITPSGNSAQNRNCQLLKCNLLYPEELDEAFFINKPNNIYCDGTDLKCYEFTKDQLKYVIPTRGTGNNVNQMCQINSCKPARTSCGRGNPDLDDTYKITNNPEEGYESEYVATILRGTEIDYINKINNVQTSSKPILCEALNDCIPLRQKYLQCTTETNGAITTFKLHQECQNYNNKNPEIPSTCSENGQCQVEIDCNDAANKNQPLCVASDVEMIFSSITDEEDKTLSFFYRPKPLNKSLIDCTDENNRNSVEICKSLDNCYQKDKQNDLACKRLKASGNDKTKIYRQFQVNPGNDICYSHNDLYDNNYDSDDKVVGFQHSSAFNQTRSPGICGRPQYGHRGTGIGYLCGAAASRRLTDDAAYQKGYVRTVFGEYGENSSTHVVTVCVRFNNTMRIDKTCGKRECAINYYQGAGYGENYCGHDYCFDLKIHEALGNQCFMRQDSPYDLFDTFNAEKFGEGAAIGAGVGIVAGGIAAPITAPAGALIGGLSSAWNSKNLDCLAKMDTDSVRVRAVKYGNKICNFLDLKGVGNYDGIADFYDGNKKLKGDENICVSGTIDKDGKCKNSIDTTSQGGRLDVWRTAQQISYISQDYREIDGTERKEQHCANITMRIDPPAAFNIGNINNSSSLYLPPLYIKRVNIKRSLNDNEKVEAPANNGQKFGKTDFFYPEIEVLYNDNTYKLSLGANYTGGEEYSKMDPLGKKTVATTFNNQAFKADIFIRKEYDATQNQPKLCLYRQVIDSTGSIAEPYKIDCVDRNVPYARFSPNLEGIAASYSSNESVITPNPNNSYNDAAINFQFKSKLKSSNANTVNSQIINLKPESSKLDACNSSLEVYEICASKEQCSELKSECIKNKIDKANARMQGQPLASYNEVEKNCKKLKELCDRKEGFVVESVEQSNGSFETTRDKIANADKAYGWFNEICITKGLNYLLNDFVVAHKLEYGIKGKCKIVTILNNANCNKGGDGKNCLCEIANDSTNPGDGMTIRRITHREAGLCIDIPEAKTCPPIRFTNRSPGDYDEFYVEQSLGKIASAGYNNQNGVNTYHQNRNQAVDHAEFDEAIEGMNFITGTCNGFWKHRIDNGVKQYPQRNCQIGSSGNPSWSNPTETGQCQRYECPEIDVLEGVGENDLYPGNYAINESGESMGLFNGFANWDNWKLQSDFAIIKTAKSCIPGFKASGSKPVALDSDDQKITLDTQNEITLASIEDQISEYQEGSLPERLCNQNGTWNQALDSNKNKSCERIYCTSATPIKPMAHNCLTDDLTQDQREQCQLWQNTICLDNTLSEEDRVTCQYWQESYCDANYPEPITPQQQQECNNWLASTPLAGEPKYLGVDKWELYINSKGAQFANIAGSRSTKFVQNGSIAVGRCAQELGFFPASSGNLPTRECDHLGNWKTVENGCVSTCQEITSPNSDHGFASWNETSIAADGGKLTVTASGCLDGKHAPLYPHLYDEEGYKYLFSNNGGIVDESQINTLAWDIDTLRGPSDQGYIVMGGKNGIRYSYQIDDSSGNEVKKYNTIAYRIANDARNPGYSNLVEAQRLPKRTCKPLPSAKDAANVWSDVSATCTKQCPGGNNDPRIGVGVTEHPGRNGTIRISWPNTDAGQTIYIDSAGNLDVDDFEGSNRTNGAYSVSRTCGSNGKWNDGTTSYCVARGSLDRGNIDSYKANINATASYTGGRIPANNYSEQRSTCMPGYEYAYDMGNWKFGLDSAGAIFRCHPGPNGNIDQNYFIHKWGRECGIYCNSSQLPGLPSGVGWGSALGNIQYSQAVSTNAEFSGFSCSGNNICGDANSVRLKCNSNGNWYWDGTSGACRNCRNCHNVDPSNNLSDISAGWWCASHTFKQDANAKESSLGKAYPVPTSLNHGESRTICAYSADTGWWFGEWHSRQQCRDCHHVHQNMIFECNDGNLTRSWGTGGKNDCLGDEWDQLYERGNNESHGHNWQCGDWTRKWGGLYIEWD